MNLTQLKENIKYRLGSPVIMIEMTEEQMDICISDALDKYYQYNANGFQKGIYVLSLVNGTSEYTLPNNIESVIYYIDNGNSTGGLPSFKKLFGESLLFSAPNMDLIGYAMSNAYIREANLLLSPKYDYAFNRLTKNIKFLSAVDTTVIALYVNMNMSEDIESIYSDSWFQKYSSCLCKIQWASNIGKYDQSFISGTKLNYSEIMQQGLDAKEKLEEELYENLNTQPMFFFG